jgi:hypothetical protein
MKIVAASLAALLLVWAGAAWFIHERTAAAERELHERRALLEKYESLRDRWSEKAQRKALKKFETMLRLYGIRPEMKKRRERKVYTFVLTRKNADMVLGKTLESPLAIRKLEVERIDDGHLKVRLEVAL